MWFDLITALNNINVNSDLPLVTGNKIDISQVVKLNIEKKKYENLRKLEKIL